MNKYEVTLILDGKAGIAKKKKVNESFEKIVKSLKGKIAKSDEWGVKDLAYKIGKSSTGLFLHFILELDGVGAKDLKDKLRTEEPILRYLIVRKER